MKRNTVNGNYLLSLILILSMPVIEGARLRCIQCNSIINPHCGDPNFDVPSPCERSHNYCMTFRVLSETGGEAIMKGCSQRSYNECVVRRIGELTLTLCRKSCEIDGCNTNILK